MTIHSSHPDIVARLKRAHGHLAAVPTMFEQGRSCLDLAQQLHAVESAVANEEYETAARIRDALKQKQSPA